MKKIKSVLNNKFFKLNFIIVGLLVIASYQIQNQIKSDQHKLATQVKSQGSNVNKWMNQNHMVTANN